MIRDNITSSVCTLFEGHYHYGVATLANSLYKQGFRGYLFAGYKGKLPFWSEEAVPNDSLKWVGAKTLDVAPGFKIHFLPVITDYHLTNYKPDFMLSLLAGPASYFESFFYFDPDIVVTAPWSFYESWINSGVALCEDVNSPISEFHPRRVAWREYFSMDGFELIFKNSIYANGGFIGVSQSDISFLSVWQKIQLSMAPVIGGLDRSSLTGSLLLKEASGAFAPFGKTDQDALNAAVEAWNGRVSFVGKEGMAFIPGACLMPHAVGQPKPWQYKPLFEAIVGRSPSTVEREYWKIANVTIITHSSILIQIRRFSIGIAAFIGRFYRRR